MLIIKPNTVPIKEAIDTLPQKGIGISYLRKLCSSGLKIYNKASSITIEQHPMHDNKTNIVNISLN